MNINKYSNRHTSRFTVILTLMLGTIAVAQAQSTATATNTTAEIRSTLKPIEVTARKWNEPLQSVPCSVTVQTSESLQNAGIQDLRDAARYVPNLTLGDFSVRRLTFPYVRGIGSGRNSPAVTTCLDGVPQLSYSTANQQLLDIDRIEFLRGSQGSLYGRNTLGGAINIVPRIPSRDPITTVTLSGGDYGFFDGRFTSEGPLGAGKTAGSLSAGYSIRDGYTINDMTGNRLDDRKAFFGRSQIVWPDYGPWDFRLSISGETDCDGDYTLYDLASIRARPYHIAHDYEGSSERDFAQPVFTAKYHGNAVDMTSVTAFQWWQSHDITDLDTTAADLLRRNNAEDQNAWIEELRFSSPDSAPVKLADHVAMRWLVGTFAFLSDYTQRSFTEYRPGAVQMLGIPFPFEQHEDADLRNSGVSLFGHATFLLDERMEFGLGLRHDYEHHSAALRSYANPLMMPGATSAASSDYNQTSPRASLGYHITSDALVYAETSKGYKSGGFNTLQIPGHTAFDEETSWTYETGLKTAWLKNHIIVNIALFRTEWDSLQMDVPTGAPGVFYIDNAGKAWSQGCELELTLHPVGGLNLFGGIGLLDSEFCAGSISGGVDVKGKELPFAPGITWHAGTEYSQALSANLRGFARIEGIGTGNYYYDAINGASQESYVVVNTRLGLTGGAWRLEGWVNNLFDKDYVPIAFPYQFAQSGYVGENGSPRTIGVSISRSF